MSDLIAKMIDKDKFLREMAIERNNYANDCNERIAKEYGKIDGADYMLNRILEVLREQNCGAEMTDNVTNAQ